MSSYAGPEANRTSAVNPSMLSVAALAKRPDDGPIIMLNLLRFAPDGGREAYRRYTAVSFGTVQARGGSVPLTAPVVAGNAAWDTATLVRYPRRAAYLDMQNDPAYIGAIPDRTAGLAARLLYPFFDPNGGPDEPFEITLRRDGHETFAVCLTDQEGPSLDGEVVLRLNADMPMVSDRIWDQLTVLRFANQEAAEAAQPDRSDHTIWLLTKP